LRSADWLTQEELLAELDQAGITLAERTLRFWVANGVLASPVRKPFHGADGRVGYYPRDTLALIPRVLKLQDEGWKLRQIKERLPEAAPPERPHRSTHAASEDAEALARRYLADLMTDTEARDRRRCFSSPGAASSELRQIRHYLVARLERLVGRSTAVRATSAFLLALDAKEMKRLTTRLKVSSSARRAPASPATEVSESSLRATLSSLDRTDLAEQVGHQARGLAPYLSQPASPLLLRRTLSTLETIQNALTAKDSRETTASLAKALVSLDQIEQQARANLDYLEQSPPDY
jgi:DNA-binding transcriptional MerR regulator